MRFPKMCVFFQQVQPRNVQGWTVYSEIKLVAILSDKLYNDDAVWKNIFGMCVL